jgi:hypothetical protein
MKIQALLFMCNDFDRAKFTLDNFSKHNPDIPISVINSGGESPKKFLDHNKNIIEFIDEEDLWHRRTHCGRGGFGLKYIDVLFRYGLNSNFTHTLYLETDVLTNRQITIEPKYDLSGVFIECGPKEQILWDYFNISDYRYHTGCGGTIFTTNFFNTISSDIDKFNMFKKLYDLFPEHYYMDLILTLVARYSNLTYGHWEEISDIRAHMVGNNFVGGNVSATLVHGYKI